MPRFSVIIPAYNAGAFLADALHSVGRQTFRDFDVTIVDDGSTDNTRVLAKQWMENNTSIRSRFIAQPNKGIAAARNQGLRHAAGDYVAFLDADDLWLEGKLEAIADLLSHASQVDVICHDEWEFGDRRNRNRLSYGPHTTYEDFLYNGNCLSTSATIVRRSFISRVGGFSEDPRFNGVEDYDLWLRLARECAVIRYLHEPLGLYRVHGGGITSDVARYLTNSTHLLEHHFSLLGERGPLERYRMRKRISGVARSMGRRCLEGGDCLEARRYFWKALRGDPLSAKTLGSFLLSLRRGRQA